MTHKQPKPLKHVIMILECRTECVERNQGVIVRVHLEEIMVHVGLCRNLTSSSSQVTPYICDRKIGVWTFDENVSEL